MPHKLFSKHSFIVNIAGSDQERFSLRSTFFIRVKYITRRWVRTIRPAMKLRGGYSSPDCPVNRSHSIKYLPAGRCSSIWIGFRTRCESSRMQLIPVQTTHPRSNRSPRQLVRGRAKRDGAVNAPHCGSAHTRDDRDGAARKPSGGISAEASIAAARYVHHCDQADKDHDWTGTRYSARNKGSAGDASGRHRASAIQGRIDVCKDILNGFEVMPANSLVGETARSFRSSASDWRSSSP